MQKSNCGQIFVPFHRNIYNRIINCITLVIRYDLPGSTIFDRYFNFFHGNNYNKIIYLIKNYLKLKLKKKKKRALLFI